MAILRLILSGNSAARSIPDVGVIIQPNRWLRIPQATQHFCYLLANIICCMSIHDNDFHVQLSQARLFLEMLGIP